MNFHPQPFAVGLAQRRDRKLTRVIVGKQSLLFAVPADYLAEVALAVEQSHTYDRHAEIAGGLELIARYIAEAAGVDGQRFAQHEFHAEVRDADQAGIGVRLLEPGGRLSRIVRHAREPLDSAAEFRGLQALPQALLRYGS